MTGFRRKAASLPTTVHVMSSRPNAGALCLPGSPPPSLLVFQFGTPVRDWGGLELATNSTSKGWGFRNPGLGAQATAYGLTRTFFSAGQVFEFGSRLAPQVFRPGYASILTSIRATRNEAADGHIAGRRDPRFFAAARFNESTTKSKRQGKPPR